MKFCCVTLFFEEGLVLSTCETTNSSDFVFHWVDLDGLYYWVSENVTDFETAQCVCISQSGDVRLAILQSTETYSAVSNYLNFNYDGEYWIDAVRPSGAGDYIWGNGCTLSQGDPRWSSNEPQDGDVYMGTCRVNGNTELCGAPAGDQLYRLLCQSVTPPHVFGPAPGNLTWVTLGSSGHVFGFSNQSLSFYEAREECSRHPGDVYLANLDMEFWEVAQYIFHNDPDGHYWIDATRPNASSQWTWGDGVPINSTFWAVGEPAGDELFARLRLRNGMVSLTGKFNPERNPYKFVCQRTEGSDDALVTLTWTSVGSAEDLFGFSTVQLDFRSAHRACAYHAGDVRLAYLDDVFSEVAGYIASHSPHRPYWVDASLSDGDSSFKWFNGVDVDSSVWIPGGPVKGHTLAHLTLTDGHVRLISSDNPNTTFYVICREEVTTSGSTTDLTPSDSRIQAATTIQNEA
ncbi:hypothetical protein BaRGS_00022399, partial [Batillaria attramentaria]